MTASLASQTAASKEKPSLAELALVFLKLGTVAFGGPAVHIALMEDEFVWRRHWITQAEFLDRLAAASLIPGPSSTEVGLASELPLRWVMITDEYGTDPTLRFKDTSVNINVLTMISKRIERDEHVDVFALLQKNRETLSAAEKRFR